MFFYFFIYLFILQKFATYKLYIVSIYIVLIVHYIFQQRSIGMASSKTLRQMISLFSLRRLLCLFTYMPFIIMLSICHENAVLYRMANLVIPDSQKVILKVLFLRFLQVKAKKKSSNVNNSFKLFHM